MNRRQDDPDDEFFAPVLREPPPPDDVSRSGVVSDTGVPGVPGGGRGRWAQSPPPSNAFMLRLLGAALVLLVGVVLAVLALLAGRGWLALVPGVLAAAAGAYLAAVAWRRSRTDGGPPTFG
ncbi:hypothetical protein HII36_51275 [Nonomuraea sp. NN258]|uniref:hypothetical protein n=1 Tax=Nonomuraea antri TaxID=2730852 RepID=UPI0015694CFB|nr:hypothetical protein [Nonomuraea antri]NRQ40154.1 hypothetical protein [Nonomuraea antri]